MDPFQRLVISERFSVGQVEAEDSVYPASPVASVTQHAVSE